MSVLILRALIAATAKTSGGLRVRLHPDSLAGECGAGPLVHKACLGCRIIEADHWSGRSLGPDYATIGF